MTRAAFAAPREDAADLTKWPVGLGGRSSFQGRRPSRPTPPTSARRRGRAGSARTLALRGIVPKVAAACTVSLPARRIFTAASTLLLARKPLPPNGHALRADCGYAVRADRSIASARISSRSGRSTGTASSTLVPIDVSIVHLAPKPRARQRIPRCLPGGALAGCVRGFLSRDIAQSRASPRGSPRQGKGIGARPVGAGCQCARACAVAEGAAEVGHRAVRNPMYVWHRPTGKPWAEGLT